MAKYRYIETGKEFDDEKDAFNFLCDSMSDCLLCPLSYKCIEGEDACAENLIKMYYQECEFELIDSTLKFRLAEILGVEEDQEWTIEGNPDIIFRIHNGERQWKGKSSRKWDYCCQEVVLTKLINNPDLIQPVSLTKWTEREIEIVKAWKTLNSDMTQFTIDAINSEEIEIDGIPLKEDPEECPNFFSYNNKQIKVTDILGES